jgi:hypothetical protein
VAIVVLKLFLAPLLVVGSTLAGRRWGDGLAGILVALPVVAGPILFITYQLHGAEFAAAAAASSLLGLVSLAGFALVFARAGRRCHWSTSTGLGWAAVLVLDLALSAMPVTVVAALPVTVVASCVAIALMPVSEPDHAPSRGPGLGWELASRAVVTALLVLAITTASGSLGPGWTGLLAPFPTALTVVVVFVHARRGPGATTRTLRGALLGLFGFAVFCAVVAVSVGSIGTGAFLAGLLAAVLVQVVVVSAATRGGPPATVSR